MGVMNYNNESTSKVMIPNEMKIRVLLRNKVFLENQIKHLERINMGLLEALKEGKAQMQESLNDELYEKQQQQQRNTSSLYLRLLAILPLIKFLFFSSNDYVARIWLAIVLFSAYYDIVQLYPTRTAEVIQGVSKWFTDYFKHAKGFSRRRNMLFGCMLYLIYAGFNVLQNNPNISIQTSHRIIFPVLFDSILSIFHIYPPDSLMNSQTSTYYSGPIDAYYSYSVQSTNAAGWKELSSQNVFH